MKASTIALSLFAAIAMAAPSPAPAAVEAEVVGNILEARACPGGGYECRSGVCWKYTCFSSGWCQWDKTSYTC
ncbi:hypothetical protein QBC39DRAFT_368733 [Podospora conica]|nr:hypothetical protein QBC39DRAFT_368733 [Schizothecium conicum]